MSRHIRRFGPIAVLAVAALLSGCSTARSVGDALWPFDGDSDASEQTAPEDGRISILAFEQQLSPDPALAGRTITLPPPGLMTDWSQPGGSADNSPAHVQGSSALDRGFRANLGEGSDNGGKLASTPVVSEGKLFFLDADHQVRAFDAQTGDELWSERLRPEESRDRRARGGGVAAVGGRVFVTTGFGFIVALNASDGAEVWRTEGGAPFHSAPTVSGGRVYATTNDSELLAFDTATGAVQWNYQAIAEPARILSASSVAVEGDTVVAPFASGEVAALAAVNGRRLWTDSLSRTGRLTSLSAINDIAGRPVVEAGVVYAASHSGVLAAIDLRTGQRIWARGFASTQTPWIAGDVLYAVSVDGELTAFDRATGGIFWVRQLRRYEEEDERKGRVSWAGPILVGGKLVLASSLGEVVSVIPENGEVSGRADLEDPIFIPPIAAGGMIYIVTDDARLVVLR